MDYVLSQDTAKALSQLLDQQRGARQPIPKGSPSQQIALVQCTSAALGTLGGSGSSGSYGGSSTMNYYSGLVKLWRTDDGIGYGYNEDATNAVCYLVEAQNATLTNGTIYLAQRSDFFTGSANANALPLFVTCIGSSGYVTLRVVTNVCGLTGSGTVSSGGI